MDRGQPTSGQQERVGQVIRGMYRLTRMIGKGGMGEIYEAEHISIPRRYAIKLLIGDCARDEDVLRRFHQEASIAASLGSDNIVEVIDFNQAEDGAYYMAMELLEGESLREYLERVGRLSPQRWLAIMEQVSDGLHAAHEAQIVHRDLKPDNLFLTSNSRGDEVVKVLDFGVSKFQSDVTMHTKTGALIGTAHYMSPEQAEGGANAADARSDIFALGIIAFQALSGKLAFNAPAITGILMKICYEEPEPLEQLVPSIPVGVAAAVHKAMAKDPAERFETVPEFVAAYREGLAAALPLPDALAEEGAVRIPAAAPNDAALDATIPAMERTPIGQESTLSAAASQVELPPKRQEHKKRPTVWAVSAGVVVALAAVLAFALTRDFSGDRSDGKRPAGSGAPSMAPPLPSEARPSDERRPQPGQPANAEPAELLMREVERSASSMDAGSARQEPRQPELLSPRRLAHRPAVRTKSSRRAVVRPRTVRARPAPGMATPVMDTRTHPRTQPDRRTEPVPPRSRDDRGFED